MLTTVTLGPSQRALCLRDAKAWRWLGPGRHRLWGRRNRYEVRAYDLDQSVTQATPELLAVLPPNEGVEHTVGARELGLVSVDGRPDRVILPGRWVLWQARAEVTCENLSTASAMGALPDGFFGLAPASHVRHVAALPYERVLVYADGVLAGVVSGRVQSVFVHGRVVTEERVDLRERERQIVGQEVMTADKVTLRLNLVVKLRVVDPVRMHEAVAALDDAVYSEAQLCARRHLAGLTLDALLERRGTLGPLMRDELAPRMATWGVELIAVDVKDVVLPGEMRTLLNQVIEADKRAAANVILRREETAATRALANTARLLESNPTLLRLKELETWKELASSVGQVNIVATTQQMQGALSLPLLPAGSGDSSRGPST